MQQLQAVRRWSLDLNYIWPWMGAILTAGIVGGVWARINMRIVSTILGHQPSFSVGGTAGIVIGFCIAAALVTSAVLAARQLVTVRPGVQMGMETILLFALLMPLFYLVATGDAPGASRGELLRLLLLFVPIPVVMGVLALWLGWRNEAKVQIASLRIGLGWLAGLLGAGFLCSLSLLSLGEEYMRHPRLVSALLSPGSTSITQVQDRSMIFVTLFFLLWLVQVGLLVRHDVLAGRSPWRSLLLLLLPVLLLAGITEIPPFLRSISDTAWMHGLVLAAGLAIFVALLLDAQRERIPGWVAALAIAGWVAATVWLVAGGNAGYGRLPAWTEWLTWGILAVTLLPVTILPVLRGSDGGLPLALLTLLVAGWLLIWLAAMSLPALILRNQAGFATSLGVPLFWMLWLLLPAALLLQGRTTPARAPVAIGQPG